MFVVCEVIVLVHWVIINVRPNAVSLLLPLILRGWIDFFAELFKESLPFLWPLHNLPTVFKVEPGLDVFKFDLELSDSFLDVEHHLDVRERLFEASFDGGRGVAHVMNNHVQKQLAHLKLLLQALHQILPGQTLFVEGIDVLQQVLVLVELEPLVQSHVQARKHAVAVCTPSQLFLTFGVRLF